MRGAEPENWGTWNTPACRLFLPLVLLLYRATALAQQPSAGSTNVAILEIEGTVQVSRVPSSVWDPAYVNQPLHGGDRVRTGERSRALVRLSKLTTWRLAERSLLQLPEEPQPRSIFNLLRGALYFFHRDQPGTFPVKTPTMSAIVRGTEFVLRVEDDGTSHLLLLDGEVDVSNDFGQLELKTGEAALVRPGQPPVKTAVIEAINVVQWALYYPGVLDVDELDGLNELNALNQLNESLAAYRVGDLLQALAKYPAERMPDSADETIYLAALLLSVGQVEHAEKWLAKLNELKGLNKAGGPARMAQALHRLIAAVKGQPVERATARGALKGEFQLSTEWLAESYYLQAQLDLGGALWAARAATEKSPDFGFAWARVAELEFSFGHIAAAQEALRKSLELAPRNAQAVALNGFLLSAENRIPQAIAQFDQAIALDGALGNAWLGRGLCRIRMGDMEEGRADMQIAATLEPNRSLFRSYLGKAWQETYQRAAAAKELALASSLDTNDPTPGLYSALLKQEANQINPAIDDLERSMDLNENRRIYRSQLLLDQDRAVRGANLASIYRDAGMFDLSVREAGRAVNADYANFSAHLFLANSYSALLNYTPQVNLRYETPRVSEYLVATLLAPVGAGVLSPTVSQQEYSKLFERDRLGFTSTTEYLSRGAWAETAAQFGTFRNFSYALDAYYQFDPGQRANNDLEVTVLSPRAKFELTPTDSIFLQAVYSDGRFGDLAQYYDPSNPTNGANRHIRSKETQEPILLAGYHREWSPNSHTLFLAGRLQDTLRVNNPIQGTLLRFNDTNGLVEGAMPFSVTNQHYQSELEIYTAEAQHIFQHERYALVFGGRYQSGDFETENANQVFAYVNAANTILPPAAFNNPRQDFRSDFERANFYGYAHWQALEAVRLIGGLSYDRLTFPVNFRYAPVSEKEDTEDQVSPKAGLILTPWKDTVVRAAYTRSLGGASIDQSFQLEPSQVAGFNQSWRSLIPESVTGANAAEQFENWGVSLEQRFPTRTYAAVSGDWIESEVDRVVGTYDLFPPPSGVFPTPPFVFQSGARQKLDFTERTLTVTLNQLVGAEWTFGARYRLSDAELHDAFPEIPSSAQLFGGLRARQKLEATLHQVNLLAIYNHPSGFFAQADSIWSAQSNRGYNPDIPGDDFWQFNAYVGYRFPRRQAEVRVGLLNLTDKDYRLNPLNLTSELPRERTIAASLRFSF
jgi:tetratricopeptide (TPR) repeat protein